MGDFEITLFFTLGTTWPDFCFKINELTITLIKFGTVNEESIFSKTLPSATAVLDPTNIHDGDYPF